MAKEPLLGLMVGSISANTPKTRREAMENLSGRMGVAIVASGSMVSSTEKERLSPARDKKSTESGKKAKE